MAVFFVKFATANHVIVMEIGKYLKYLATFKFWKELFIMTFGMLMCSAAVYYFMMPSKLVVGSMTGLSIVIANVATMLGVPLKVSVVVTVINAILLLLAWILIGKEFGAKTVYTAMILGPLIAFWEKVLPYERFLEPGQTSIMGDIWFDLLAFVLILSASQALLFHINASTGGLDILAKIVNKFFHLDIGTSVTVAGAIICCTAFAINPFRLVVIGLMGTWINGLTIDYFTAGLNRRKRVCIISLRYEEVRDFIVNKLHRGCSLYEMQGGYSGEYTKEIQVLLTKTEFSDLMDFMRKNDIHSFVTAGNVSEVYGLWNNKKKNQA